MKKYYFLITALVLCLVTSFHKSAVAQIPTNNIEPINNAQGIQKDNNIKKLLEITGAKDISRQVIIQLVNDFQLQYPQVPKKLWDNFTAEINLDEMTDELVPVYSKYFSNEEIKQLITFYQTPVGKKTITVTPQIFQESYEIGKRYGTAAAQRALKKLESEGYIRSSQ